MSVYIFGIRIYLDSDPTVANASDIGLYDDADNGANQVFRWIESDISSYSPTYAWKTGVLIPDAIGTIAEGADFADGGSAPTISGTSVKATNTLIYGGSFTQLDYILDANDLRLNGLRCDITEFEIVSGSLVAANGKVRYRGICGDIKDSEKQLVIPVEPPPLKRRANLATVINSTDYPNASGNIIGGSVPVTLGEYVPEFDADGNVVWNGYARFGITADSKDILLTSNRNYIGNNSFESSEKGLVGFPVVGTDGGTPSKVFDLKLGLAVQWYDSGGNPITSGTFSPSWFVGKYITVVEGLGNGESRLISAASVDVDGAAGLITLTVADYFETQPNGNSTAKLDDNSWCSIYAIERQYSCDVWDCKGYLDENGDAITSGVNLYTYDREKKVTVSGEEETVSVDEKRDLFYRLPQYAYNDIDDGKNTTVEIDVKLFTSDIDTINSFLILPVESPSPAKTINLGKWDADGTEDLSSFKYLADGLYTSDADPIGRINSFTVTGVPGNVADQDPTTNYEMDLGYVAGAGSHKSIFAFLFDMPDVPKSFSFDGVYLIINYSGFHFGAASPSDEVWFRAKTRKFMGYASNILSASNGDYYSDYAVTATIKDDPDFYYLTNIPSTANLNFYYNNELSDPASTFQGYKKFLFSGVDSVDKYNAIVEGCVYQYHDYGGIVDVTKKMTLYELAIAFIKKVSIKDAIYSPFDSRVYDNTWGARKTATDMIVNPIDMLEHVKRLGNWSEQGETKDWGKEYATNPLIDTATTEGGFDYEDLDTIKDLRPSRQILDYNGAWTDELTKSLCKSFFICAFQDPVTGNEQVSYIAEKSITTPTTTITLSDIIGNIGEVIYPKASGIYCEPVIRYAKNNANDEYDKVIQITNANAAAYDSSYVIGLSGASAELMWTRANLLWSVYRQIEKPPDSLTKSDWIINDNDAVWFLDTWFSWMGAISTDGTPSGVEFEPKKRITFTVPYATGKDWFITQHHLLQLPHQTNDSAIEFVIENVSKNIGKGTEAVTVQAILYGSATEIALYVQDTYTNGTALADWQDTYDTQAGAPTNGPDIQDIT